MVIWVIGYIDLIEFNPRRLKGGELPRNGLSVYAKSSYSVSAVLSPIPNFYGVHEENHTF